MKDIVEEIQELKNELEVKIQDYTAQDVVNDINIEPQIYGKSNDFSVYYPQQPFQREIGRIKR